MGSSINFLLLLSWFALNSILFVNICVSVSCPLIFFLCYRVKNNSPILCELFWTISFLWQPLLDWMFQSLQFFILLGNQWVKSMKNVAQYEFTLRKVSDNNLKFSQQCAPGNTFSCILSTHVAIIMTNYFKRHYFNIFLRLFYCIISLFLYFRIISE